MATMTLTLQELIAMRAADASSIELQVDDEWLANAIIKANATGKIKAEIDLDLNQLYSVHEKDDPDVGIFGIHEEGINLESTTTLVLEYMHEFLDDSEFEEASLELRTKLQFLTVGEKLYEGDLVIAMILESGDA